MRGRIGDIRHAGADLIVVGNGSVKSAAAFQARRAPDLRVYTDPSRSTYEALGMIRSAMAVLRPSSLIAAARATAKGHIQTSIEGDGAQQGGFYAALPGGRLVYAHANRSAGDRPQVDAALRAISQAAGGGPGGRSPGAR